MKSVISAEYAEMNRQLHAAEPNYGASAGARHAQEVVEIAQQHRCKIILDYGCGKGTLKPAVKALDSRLRVDEFDPAVRGRHVLPERKPDMIVALDVMEHIEADMLDNVLATMQSLAPRIVWMVIALHPATRTLPDGRNAHLIVEEPYWWQSTLASYFTEISVTKKGYWLKYLGTPKRDV